MVSWAENEVVYLCVCCYPSLLVGCFDSRSGCACMLVHKSPCVCLTGTDNGDVTTKAGLFGTITCCPLAQPPPIWVLKVPFTASFIGSFRGIVRTAPSEVLCCYADICFYVIRITLTCVSTPFSTPARSLACLLQRRYVGRVVGNRWWGVRPLERRLPCKPRKPSCCLARPPHYQGPDQLVGCVYVCLHVFTCFSL